MPALCLNRSMCFVWLALCCLKQRMHPWPLTAAYLTCKTPDPMRQLACVISVSGDGTQPAPLRSADLLVVF